MGGWGGRRTHHWKGTKRVGGHPVLHGHHHLHLIHIAGHVHGTSARSIGVGIAGILARLVRLGLLWVLRLAGRIGAVVTLHPV